MRKPNVAVIFGGRSGEHEISLLSAHSVLENIDRDCFEVVEVGITLEGIWMVGENVLQKFEEGHTGNLFPACLLAEPGNHMLYSQTRHADGIQLHAFHPIDIVFPVLHGTFGEDGTLQGLLECLDIAYVGAGVLASSVGMDKALFKAVMRSINIPVVSDQLISRKEIETDMLEVIDRCEKFSPYPLFTKPANMGSSVGINKCRNRQQLKDGLRNAAQYDRRVLVEVGLEKPMEIEISILGNELPLVSIPGEIVPGDDFYTYDDKYINGISRLNIPAELPDGMAVQIQEMAIRAYKAIDCAGMARVDFLIDQETGHIFLNELNTIPGFTKISMYSKLWEESGIHYPDLITRLLNLALDRHKQQIMSLHHYQRREE